MIKSVVPGNPVSDVSRFIENLVGSSHSDIMCNTSITASDNVMDGGLGNDVMTGGNGDDNYVVNAAGDVVTEVAGQGTDRVQSAVAYTLATRPDIENLTLTGVTNSNGTGNGASNILIGNDGCQHSEGECWRRFSDRWGGFVYAVLGDSPVGASVHDQILDFESGIDKINLNAMDANLAVAGNQNFAFIGTAAFTAPGQVRYAGGLLEANVGGANGKAAGLQIELVNAPALIVSDLIL